MVAGWTRRPAAASAGWQAVTGPGADRGMVFQSYTLFPWLTVLQNVCFGLREKGLPLARNRRIAHQFIAKVGLQGFENHFPKQLSGGMQQRTALARALANDPRILLMDEPFGALDHQTRELMQELLLGIWEAERKTVLFVTHDIDEAIFMGNRVVVMSARPGRIKCDLAVPLAHPRHYSPMKTAAHRGAGRRGRRRLRPQAGPLTMPTLRPYQADDWDDFIARRAGAGGRHPEQSADRPHLQAHGRGKHRRPADAGQEPAGRRRARGHGSELALRAEERPRLRAGISPADDDARRPDQRRARVPRYLARAQGLVRRLNCGSTPLRPRF
jgi:ABC-type nitrate/sulfonate/bicarbonate transport system ATPase subunit